MSNGFKDYFEKLPLLTVGQAEAFLNLLAQRFTEIETPGRATDVATEPPEDGGNPSSDAEAKYRALVEQIPAVIFMAFLDRAISEAYVSPQIETILNYTQDEWLADPIGWYDRIHPDDRERLSADAAQLLMFGRPVRSEYRVFARDGRPIWFRCEAKIVRTEMKVLVMSGYTRESLPDSVPASVGFLQKPFTRDELTDKVRALLDGPG